MEENNPVQTTETSHPTNTPPIQAENKPKSSRKTLVILGIIAVLFIAGISGAYFFGKSSNKETVPTPTSSPAPTDQTGNPNLSPGEPKTDETATWQTYNSTCGFSVSYPNSWSAKKFFIADSENACAYITTPDYKMWTDSRDGFYIGVTRTKLGSKGINNIINSLEDYIKDDESIMTPRVSVSEKVNKTYGSLSGISYLPVGFDPGRSFIFIKNGFLYDINWSDKEESNHIAEINEIIKSFKFTN